MEMAGKKVLQYGFVLLMIALGLLFNQQGIGAQEFVGFGSLSTWLIYIGVVSLLIVTLQGMMKKKRKTDERMEFVASKAMRITFVVFILSAFVIMVADGISPITMPYSLFMSYLVCWLLVVYVAAYNVLLSRC